MLNLVNETSEVNIILWEVISLGNGEAFILNMVVYQLTRAGNVLDNKY